MNCPNSSDLVQQDNGKNFIDCMKEFPSCANPDEIENISHAVFRAQHEIDLVNEEEILVASTAKQQAKADYDGFGWITRKQLNECKRFVEKWNKAEYNTPASDPQLPWKP